MYFLDIPKLHLKYKREIIVKYIKQILPPQLVILMEINFLKDTKDEIIMEIVGVNHTFCAALKEALYTVKGIVAASYAIDHPLVGKPRFIVKTDGKLAPKEAVKKALKAIKSQDKKMATAIDAAFK